MDFASEAAFHQNAAAAGLVLVVMTLSMNALAIYIRYRLRKNIKCRHASPVASGRRRIHCPVPNKKSGIEGLSF